MYSTRSGLILGFHGCDQSVVDNVILNKIQLNPSKNEYDWLGHGTYFWENSPSRAMDYATVLRDHPERSKKPVKNPAVVGATIDLGFCLDLLDHENLQYLKETYEILSALHLGSSLRLPKNKPIPISGNDLLIRELDCAVIQTLHTIREYQKLRPFDSVRGVFPEGKELYPNAGFREKDHIQICIRNPNCIKGFFLPREENPDYPKV